MKCPKCGYDGNKPNQKTCTLCGESLIAQIEELEPVMELGQPTSEDIIVDFDESLRPTPEPEPPIQDEPAPEEPTPTLVSEPQIEEAPVEPKEDIISPSPSSEQPLAGGGDEPVPTFDKQTGEVVYAYDDDEPSRDGIAGASSSMASDVEYGDGPAPSTTGGMSWFIYLLAAIISLIVGVSLYMCTN